MMGRFAPGSFTAAIRPRRRSFVAVLRVALALALVAGVWAAGGTQAADDALQAMGFDPDRAQLIVALVLAALAAASIAGLGGRRPTASLVGLAIAGAWFAGTFVSETERAVGPAASTGTFDPVGWALTAISLLSMTLAVGWATAVLVQEGRAAVLVAAAAVRGGRPGERRRVRPIVRVLLVAAVAIVTLPVIADIFNFDPDLHMRAGGVAAIALVGTPGDAMVAGTSVTTATTRGVATATGAALSFPRDLVAGPVTGSLITPGSLGAAAWGPPPSGAGRITLVHVRAPWTGGSSATATIEAYLPPGYDTGTRRYPVVYEAPWSTASWVRGMALTTSLDTLIRSGQLPPMIVVFASASGGPMADSECADSFDGREWFDRYMATTVVGWVDANLRTIATPAARVTMGFSQGGYCSAALMAHHPSVFQTSISVSGYYQSGVASRQTTNAWRPFNNDPALIRATSPDTVIPTLPEATRRGLMAIIEADPNNPFYGAQAQTYAATLDAAGVPMAVLPDPQGHSWEAARVDIPAMLRVAALRMDQLGVFGSGAAG